MSDLIQEVIQPGSAADVLALLNNQNKGKYADDKALATVTRAGDWFPYIQVMGSNSDAVKQKICQMGTFAMTKNRAKIDLGEEFIAMILSWRPKAMQYVPKALNFYNPNTPQFEGIVATADLPKSGKGYGSEFLLWLPDHQDLATMFFGNPTGRMEAPNLIAAMKKGEIVCKLRCELIEDKKKGNSWHGARYYKYDLALSHYPDATELSAKLDKFNNPSEIEAEPVEAAEASTDRG